MLTLKQKQLIQIATQNKYTLAYGGARSGKTWAFIDFLVYRSIKYPKSRHLICRRYAIDVRNSIFKITIPQVLQSHDMHEGQDFTTNVSEMEIRIPNGSIIVCAGLDDKERVDKVLGQEYADIYINESQDVSWATVRTLRTRLSQKIEGCEQKFIADLNPTSTNHWTYKLWFEHIDPESETQIEHKGYAKIKLSPIDNRENLPEDYIKTELETLIGNARRRFLEGEYTATNDLTIFTPVNRYTPEHFSEWANKNGWHRVQFVGGLDLGYDDADAFVIIGYIDGKQETFVVHEYKGRRNTITELSAAIKGGIAQTKQLYRQADWSNFIIHGDSGGGGKKTLSELSAVHELPLTPAYKREKKSGIDLLQDEVNTIGRLHIAENSPFWYECRKIIWTRDKNSDKIIREIDNDAYHPDVMDSVLYPFRYLWSYGNTALRRQEHGAGN